MMWIVATAVLVAGLADDFRSRKVHNELIVLLFGLSFAASLFFRDFSGTIMGIGALTLALIMTLPLYLNRAIGGGDVKLFAVFAFALNPMAAFWTLIYSLAWGAMFGLTRAALQNRLMSLVKSTYKAVGRQRPEAAELHKIPYTFALLLGWFTQLTIMKAGGLI